MAVTKRPKWLEGQQKGRLESAGQLEQTNRFQRDIFEKKGQERD